MPARPRTATAAKAAPLQAAPQPENLRLRASLVALLGEHIAGAGLDDAAAGELLGVAGPRIADLRQGRIELFSLDTLVNMLATTGLRLRISIGAAD
jgi:predicted XRE-type DNA-binding protein